MIPFKLQVHQFVAHLVRPTVKEPLTGKVPERPTLHPSHCGFATLPLLVNLATLALILFTPLDEALDRRNFQTHYEERVEVVRRIESGELWSGEPLIQLVALPVEYPRTVSNGTGQRSITVYRDEGALHVVFYPQGGLLGERSAFPYRSDGNLPSLPNRVLPDAIRSEPLGDRWHRVVFSRISMG